MPQASLGAGKPGLYSASRNLSITIAGDGVAAYAHELRTGTNPTCAGFTSTSFAPVTTPITATLPATPTTARLCVIGRNAAGELQQAPTEHTWSHLPRRVPNVPAGTKISAAAPAFTAPAPGSAQNPVALSPCTAFAPPYLTTSTPTTPRLHACLRS